jgi:FkbH-like protein
MILKLILESLSSSGATNPRRSAEWAFQAIRNNGLLFEALSATENAADLATRWLHAMLATEAGADESSLDAVWARVVDAESRDFPDALIERARLRSRRGDSAGAAQLLKQAFLCECGISTLLRSESLARKVFAQATHRRTIKIALLGSGSTNLLRTALGLLCWRDGLDATFYAPDFGTYSQEILSSGSRLYEFRPDFVVLLENWRDVMLPNLDDDPASALQSAMRHTRGQWELLLRDPGSHVIHVTLTPPSCDPALGLSQRNRNGATYFIRELNRCLIDLAPERLLLVDSESLAAKTPGTWEDPLHWSASRLYPSGNALPILAEAIVSNIRFALGLSSKLLALDLDNVLWGGIIGEDGMRGIKLGPPSPVGERYQEFQKYLKALATRGILLAIVSKNNRDDALRVFTDHDASVLKLEDFTAFEVNWGRKSESLRSVASALHLGLDSFVLLDDSPMERANIRQELPEVAVPNISGEPAESIRVLERFQFFQTSELSSEDRSRAASYQALAASGIGSSSAVTADELLDSLQMSIETGPVDEVTVNRVAQLINKTNQFNLTTRRYTLAEVTARANSVGHWFQWYRVKDRFADHGLVGILLVEGADTTDWNVDLWLMSCRVIGRRIEDFMFNSLLLAARSAGAQRITAEYIPTPKNGLASGLLSGYGFQPVGATRYSLDPNTAKPRELHYLRERFSLEGVNA